MNGITPSTIDPRNAIKTHVQEMSPAQRLAEHDRRAREANSELPEVKPGAETFETVTVANLCAIALDVVKDFARSGFDASTITPELVLEKVEQRFPNGVKLAPEPVSIEITPAMQAAAASAAKAGNVNPKDDAIDEEAEEAAEVAKAKKETPKAAKPVTPKSPPKKAPSRKPKGPSPSK